MVFFLVVILGVVTVQFPASVPCIIGSLILSQTGIIRGSLYLALISTGGTFA